MIKNKECKICPKCQRKYIDVFVTICLKCGIATVPDRLVVTKDIKRKHDEYDNTLG